MKVVPADVDEAWPQKVENVYSVRYNVDTAVGIASTQ